MSPCWLLLPAPAPLQDCQVLVAVVSSQLEGGRLRTVAWSLAERSADGGGLGVTKVRTAASLASTFTRASAGAPRAAVAQAAPHCQRHSIEAPSCTFFLSSAFPFLSFQVEPVELNPLLDPRSAQQQLLQPSPLAAPPPATATFSPHPQPHQAPRYDNMLGVGSPSSALAAGKAAGGDGGFAASNATSATLHSLWSTAPSWAIATANAGALSGAPPALGSPAPGQALPGTDQSARACVCVCVCVCWILHLFGYLGGAGAQLPGISDVPQHKGKRARRS